MTQGFVLYTDGGCRPNPGFGGWGVHGYLFSYEEPKKGSGNPEHILTNRGYMLKSDFNKLKELRKETAGDIYAAILEGEIGASQQIDAVEVTPLHYLDGVGSFQEFPVTNNIAELVAATHGLRHVSDYAEVATVLVWADSEYVCKAVSLGHLDKWASNGWLRVDQQPVKNQEYWKAFLEVYDALRQRGVKVEFKWIKGHDDLLGNEKADRLATAGVMISRLDKVTRVEMETSDAQGYWKYDSGRHPFISNRRMYFNTMDGFNDPGVYYLGEHGKEDEFIGKRIGNGAFSVVRLESPDPAIELVRNYQCSLARDIDSLLVLRLDKLFMGETHRQLSTHGKYGMVQAKVESLSLDCLDEEPLTKELRPAKIAIRAISQTSLLSELLDRYHAGDEGIVATDLTPILYETVVSVDKKNNATSSTKLRPEYTVGFATLKVDAKYGDGEKSAPILLTLGIDLLDRNALKRLEDRQPEVTLITWMESPETFRYATVITAGSDSGIWSGSYSNLRVLAPEELNKP